MRASSANMRESPDACSDPPLRGPIAILWDMENCPIPVDVNSDEVAGNIRMALRVHPAVEGLVTIFSAYGDFNQFPRRLREGCQRTGINLIDVPNGRKDASDKAILVDMFLFALDHPPPCSILLISGDVDFAPALHKLGQRGYTVLLAIPAVQAVASALCNAGRYVWDWPSVAHGEGFIPAKTLQLCARMGSSPDCANVSGGLVYQSSDDSDHIMEDELCIQGRYGVKLVNGVSRDNRHQKHRLVVDLPGLGYSPSLEKQGPSPCQQNPSHMPMHILTRTRDAQILEDNFDKLWAQPGDIEGLKNQLIKLLKLNGGLLNFTRVSGEYKKMYGRPLFLSEYGSLKLTDLFRRMGDVFDVATKGGKKILFLQECKPALQGSQVNASVCYKDARQQNEYLNYTEDDIDLVKEVILIHAKDQDEAGNEERVKEHEALLLTDDTALNTNIEERKVKLEIFKRELQELLVSHAGRLLLASFLKVYHQRYSHDLDLDALGVTGLDVLFEKVQDVAAVKEEQGSKRKFLIVSNGEVQHIVGEERKAGVA